MHLNFLYVAVSWVLLRWHQLLGAIGMDPDAGLTWALSIVLLVVTARLLLVRVFVKQVHAQRNMQKLQPKIKQLREKYQDDRPELNRQMVKLQQEEGFNPLSGFLPMFLQIPVFLGLYHVLRHLSNSAVLCTANPNNKLLELYTFSGGQGGETCGAAKANLFGAPLAASFRDGATQVHLLGGDLSATRWVIVPLLLISAAATLVTQLLVRANATVTPEGSAATIQRIMLYAVPVGVLISGLLFHFPLGVLVYWFTSNVWTLAQQAYIIRFHPPEPPTDDTNGRTGPRPPSADGDPARGRDTQPPRRPQVGRRPVRPDRSRQKQRRAATKRR